MHEMQEKGWGYCKKRPSNPHSVVKTGANENASKCMDFAQKYPPFHAKNRRNLPDIARHLIDYPAHSQRSIHAPISPDPLATLLAARRICSVVA